MDNMEKMDISIVIPAYNEEKRLGKTLKKVYEYFKNRGDTFEIIVVDDGSKDGTVNVVKTFAIDHPEVKLRCHLKNKGKGAAVKTGVMAAEGNLILFTDADLSTPIEEFEKLIYFIKEKKYDIVIASRALPDSKILISQMFYRRFIGRMFPILVKIIVTREFKDTQCGFKLFKNQVARELFSALGTTDFAFDVEILYRALKRKYKIKEVGVIWLNSPYSTVKIFKDSFRMFFSLLKIKFKC